MLTIKNRPMVYMFVHCICEHIHVITFAEIFHNNLLRVFWGVRFISYYNHCFSGESSTFNASMMTSVDPGTVAAGVPSVMSMAAKPDDIDPTKPNDHPILKVCMYSVQYSEQCVHVQCMLCTWNTCSVQNTMSCMCEVFYTCALIILESS